jgi:putative transposase
MPQSLANALMHIVSQSQKERVERYIGSQEEHHRGLSFQDEFRQLLKRHNIAFDEQYVWD